jgi:hydroxyacylglutathione hydrolase
LCPCKIPLKEPFLHTMIQIKVFTFNALQENTYLLYDETKECILIDPGCYDRSEQEELKDFIKENGLKPVKLINTHCHVDHVLGNKFVKELYGLKLYTSKEEEAGLRSVKLYASLYGFANYAETEIDEFIKEGDRIHFGNSELEILFVPGHSVGHLAFVNKEQKICIGGDVLFYQSVGRWDLPGGNQDTLLKSIQTKLFALSDDMVVYPGHGPETTIGREKRTNPFCAVRV